MSAAARRRWGLLPPHRRNPQGGEGDRRPTHQILRTGAGHRILRLAASLRSLLVCNSPVERARGVEPPSEAWEASIITVIRRPRARVNFSILPVLDISIVERQCVIMRKSVAGWCAVVLGGVLLVLFLATISQGIPLWGLVVAPGETMGVLFGRPPPSSPS